MSDTRRTLRTIGHVALAATGIGALARGMAGLGWAGTGARRLAALGRAMLRPDGEEAARLPAEIVRVEDARARFEAVREALGIGEAEIERRRAAARARFLVWFYGAVLLLAYAIAAPRLGTVGRSLGPIAALDPLLPWIICLVALLRAAHWSLLHLQLRHRALLPLRDWLRRPEEWLCPESLDLPESSPRTAPPNASTKAPRAKIGGGVRRAGTGAGAALLLLAALHPAAALAASYPGASDVIRTLTGGLNPSDLSLQWMQRLFPSITGASGVSADQDIIAQMCGTLNAMLVAFGAGVIVWGTLSGLVHAAETGKAFGTKYHGTWTPVRLALGIGSAVPIKGYCAAQLLVAQIFLAGFGLANIEWNLYVKMASGIDIVTGKPVQSGGGTAVSPDLVAQMPTLSALLKAEACIKAAEIVNRAPDGTLAKPDDLSKRTRSWTSGGRPLYAYPDANGDRSSGTAAIWDYGQVCGRISWPIRKGGQDATATSYGGDGIVFIPPTDPTPAEQAQTAFDTARADAFGRFVTSVRASETAAWATALEAPGFSASQAAPLMTDLIGRVQTAFTQLKSDILAASSTLSTALNGDARAQFATRAAKLGWASAGALQPQLARASATVVQRLMEGPDIEPPKLDLVNKDVRAVTERAIAEIGQALADAPAEVAGQAKDYEMDLAKSASENPSGTFTQLTSRFSHALTGALASHLALSVTDPMGSIQSLGREIECVTAGVWIGSWVAVNMVAGFAEGASESASNIPVVGPILGIFTVGASKALGGVLRAFQGIWSATCFWLLALAGGYLIVIPMMQYFMWSFGIFGMMVYTAEAVIGAMFWAFGHMRMEGGEDLVGPQQKHGYALCFNGFFRPTLMLFGLILGNGVFAVGASYVNATFGLAVDMAAGDRVVDPMMMVIALGAMLFLHYQLAVHSFTLITNLPDRVARWSGASGEGLGEESDFHQAHNTVVGGVFRQTQQVGGGVQGAFRGESEDTRNLRTIASALRGEGGGGGGGKGGPRPGSVTQQPVAKDEAAENGVPDKKKKN